MRRIRRVSVEVIRRELSLSVTRQVAANSRTRTEVGAAGTGERPVTSPRAVECSACASPWLVLPIGEGEEAAVLQRLLEAQGIHHQMSPRGELFVCARSFELHAGASEIADTATSEAPQKHVPKQSPNHD